MQPKDVSESKGRKIVYLAYFLWVVAVVCCLILVIIGCVGVFRGYSVQSTIPFFLPLVALLALIGVSRISMINPNRISLSVFNNFVFMVLICFGLLASLQGWHFRKGLIFYQEGNYAEAAIEFEKENQFWYHKVTPDISEPSAMHYLAQSYCQLEEFDKARNLYELTLNRYRGTVHGHLAEVSLVGLNSGLKAISGYSDQSLKGHDELDRLYMVASKYASLPCNKKAIEIYKKITEMNIPDEHKRRAYEEIQKLTPSKPIIASFSVAGNKIMQYYFHPKIIHEYALSAQTASQGRVAWT